MRLAILSPIAWRTPPRHYGPWERVVSLLTEGLVQQGVEVTLFATADSKTRAKLVAVCLTGYEEDPELLPKVWECLHISELFERASEFDLIHNHFDFLPLSYSALVNTPVVTTIHGFSSAKILPVYKKYNGRTFYVAISDADRSPELDYVATVHHGIDLENFTFRSSAGDYLLFFGRFHPDKGAHRAIEIARQAGRKLIMAGIIQDETYYRTMVRPHIDGENVVYLGSAGPRQRDELLGGALALLHPIGFNEPFGLSVVESMACGTPVIAFNRGSMPELIRDGVTGFLVSNLKEAVEAVAALGTIKRQDCRHWVEVRFSAERMVRDYLRVYEEVLARSRSAGRQPWGRTIVLAREPEQLIKKLVVEPGQHLSLPPPRAKRLHWHLLAGVALVSLGGKKKRLGRGGSLDVGPDQQAVLRNPGPGAAVVLEIEHEAKIQASASALA